MDTLEQDSDQFNEAFYGFGSGFHELGPDEPTALDEHPGRFRCDDPEETDLNTLAALKVERKRLRDLVPGSDVFVDKRYGSFECDTLGELEDVKWVVSIQRGKVSGRCRADVTTTTLREACDAALADYRAKSLDAVAAVAAEGAVAA